MLTTQEAVILSKIEAKIDEKTQEFALILARNEHATFDILRHNQGMISGLDWVRNEIIPELIEEIRKQRA